jgi:hypothetical protein
MFGNGGILFLAGSNVNMSSNRTSNRSRPMSFRLSFPDHSINLIIPACGGRPAGLMVRMGLSKEEEVSSSSSSSSSLRRRRFEGGVPSMSEEDSLLRLIVLAYDMIATTTETTRSSLDFRFLFNMLAAPAPFF